MQQDEILAHDYRAALREFNKIKALEEKNLKAGIKLWKKEHKNATRGDVKTYEQNVTADWEARQTLKLEQFEKKEKQQREEEVSLLKTHHEFQTEKFMTSLGMEFFMNGGE